MAYSVDIYSVDYRKSSSLHSTRQFLQAEHGEQFFNLTCYTFTPHLIMGQVFYGSDPFTFDDPVTDLLRCDSLYGRSRHVRCGCHLPQNCCTQ